MGCPQCLQNEGSGVDGDDLVYVGTIGRIKAINSFR